MREQLQSWVKTAGDDEVREAFRLFVQGGNALSPDDVARLEAVHKAIVGGAVETKSQEDVRAHTLQRLKDAGVPIAI